MAARLRQLSQGAGRLHWAGLAGLLALLALGGALAGSGVTAPGSAGAQVGALTETPALAWRADAPWHPLRWFTPVAVHLSTLHLLANLAGALLLAVLGLAARLPGAAALAWLAAWPLTHALLAPALGLFAGGGAAHLAFYGGLSGVLHAGVAVAALHMAVRGPRGLRWIGAALLAGLLAKLHGEAFWLAPLRSEAGWGFPVAVVAHATGTAAGLLCGTAALLLTRRPAPAPWR